MAKIKEIDWFTDEMSQSLLNTIANSTAQELRYLVTPGTTSRLTKLINRLDRLYKNEQNQYNKFVNKLDYYNTKQGWSEFIYEKNEQATYEEIFNICNEILEIMRTGNFEEEIQIAVYSTSNNGEISNIYYGNESELNTKITKNSNNKDELIFSLSESKEKLKSIEKESLIAKHYNKFSNAIKTRKSLQPIQEALSKNKINEGHIIEAYQRHLYFQHDIKRLDEDIKNNKSLTENIKTKWIAINLYYARNNEGWWTGGDVASIQNKGSNRRLASIWSIKAVASTILEIVQYYDNFDINTFKKLFTQDELNNMIKEDPKRIGNKTIQEIVNLIAKD